MYFGFLFILEFKKSLQVKEFMHMLATTNSLCLIKYNGREFNAENENAYDDKKPSTVMTSKKKKKKKPNCNF